MSFETDSSDSVLAMDYALPRDLASGSGIDRLDPTDDGAPLEGDVAACACPECGGPMSVRFWLLVADCPRCGCSIELSEEEEQALLREMESRPREPKAKARAVPLPAPEPEPPPTPALPPAFTPPEPTFAPPASEPTFQAPPPRKKKRPGARKHGAAAALAAAAVRRELAEIKAQGNFRVWLWARFREAPAWITSMVVHAVILIALAMLTLEPEKKEDQLVLSLRISNEDVVGNPDQKQFVTEPTPFELPSYFEVKTLAPADLNTQSQSALNSPAAAAVLQVKPQVDVAELRGSPEMVPGAVGMFDGRGQGSRGQLVRAFGGTTASEAAVTRGLIWLAKVQESDGSWKLHKQGGSHSDTAGTGLGLLPFLGAGQSHREGKYKETVQKGLDWLLAAQKPDGDLRSGEGSMYSHAQAAMAISEAYALTRDERLKDPAQRAVDFIVRAQHDGGGWRYQPREAGDTSVVGWQLMALRSGQMGGLKMPQDVFVKSARYLDKAQTEPTGSRYSYQPGGGPTHVMTAEALLCRQYTGWQQNHPGLLDGSAWLLREHRPDRNRSDMYYWYYATQVMHHQGGEFWKRWNSAMRDLLIETQHSGGDLDGSWKPIAHHDPRGGRIYMTSLAVLTLEVYYRHLPLYDKSAVDQALAAAPGEEPKGVPAGVQGTPTKVSEKKPPAAKTTPKNPPKKPLKPGEFDPLAGEAPVEGPAPK